MNTESLTTDDSPPIELPMICPPGMDHDLWITQHNAWIKYWNTHPHAYVVCKVCEDCDYCNNCVYHKANTIHIK